jgi:predicted ester cyclase
MSIDANKRLICRFIDEVINTGNLDALSVFVADQIIDHNAGPEHPPGIEGYKQHLRGVHSTFPDFQLTIEAQIAEGDLVVTRVIGRGTHQGAWLGIRPRGTAVVVTGINIDRLADGKIVEHWGEANTVGMLSQLGMSFVTNASVT